MLPLPEVVLSLNMWWVVSWRGEKFPRTSQPEIGGGRSLSEGAGQRQPRGQGRSAKKMSSGTCIGGYVCGVCI